MAKTLTQLIAETRQLLNQTDSTNSHFTDAELTAWINEAVVQAVTALEVLPQAANEYTVSSATVTLDTPTILVHQFKLKNPDNSGAYYLLKPISLEQLNELDSDYENATTGLPEYVARSGRNTVILYPPPKTSVTTQTTPLKTYGLELPSALSAGGDTPDLLPENVHQILPHWPAGKGFLRLGDAASAANQFSLFRGQLRDAKSVSTKWSRSLSQWRVPGSLGYGSTVLRIDW